MDCEEESTTLIAVKRLDDDGVGDRAGPHVWAWEHLKWSYHRWPRLLPLVLLAWLLIAVGLPYHSLSVSLPSTHCPSLSPSLSPSPPPPATAAPHEEPLAALNSCRLMSLMSRVKSGEAVRVAAVGGSITRHIQFPDGFIELLGRRLNQRWPVSESVAVNNHSVSGSRQHFHRDVWHAELTSHAVSNRAVSATPSSFTSICMSSFFSNSELGVIDLVLVDFAVNDLSFLGAKTGLNAAWSDGFIEGHVGSGASDGEFDPVTSLERLVKYTLSRTVSDRYPQAHPSRAIDGPAIILLEFCVQDGSTARHLHQSIADRYELPVINVCELFPFNYPTEAEAVAMAAPPPKAFFFDSMHMTVAGHAIVTAFISDRLDSIATSHRRQLCHSYEDRPWAVSMLPIPVAPANAGECVDWRCTVGDFRPGANDGDFSQFHLFDVVSNTGWEYEDSQNKKKWGWTTKTVGAMITFRLQPTSRQVILSVLRSRANIGSARIWLTSDGIVSDSYAYHAWWNQSFSTFEFVSLPPSLWTSLHRREPRSLHNATSLLLHVQLTDVNASFAVPPTSLPANRFKVVSIFET